MMRLTDLLGCRVVTSAGEGLGHVVDVRVARRKGSSTKADQRWHVVGLLTGGRGLVARLGIPEAAGRKPVRSKETIPWDNVVRINEGEIVVRQ